MKRRRMVSLAVLLFITLASAQGMGGRELGAVAEAEEKPLVAVSILPQSYFVNRIAGGRVGVLALVGSGQNPHSYEPTPRQMADLSRVKAWFTIGVEFENALIPKISALYPDLRLLDSTKGIRFRDIEAHAQDDDHGAGLAGGTGSEELAARDPHVWLGRDSVKVQIAHIRDGLISIDPEGTSEYLANHAAFALEIDALFDGLGKDLEPLRGKKVFVFHPSFGYFLDEFGIIQKAIETGGKEPTQKALTTLIGEMKMEGAKVIFVQAQFPASAAKGIAAAIGGTVVEIDPLGADWMANQRLIAQALRSAAR